MVAKICYRQLDEFLVITYGHVHSGDFHNTTIFVCSSIGVITSDWKWQLNRVKVVFFYKLLADTQTCAS